MNLPPIDRSSDPFIFTVCPEKTRGSTTYETAVYDQIYNRPLCIANRKRKFTDLTPKTSLYYTLLENQENNIYLNPLSASPFCERTTIGSSSGIILTYRMRNGTLAQETVSSLHPSCEDQIIGATKWSKIDRDIFAGAKQLFFETAPPRTELLVHDIDRVETPIFQKTHPEYGISTLVKVIEWVERSTFWVGDDESELTLYDFRTEKEVRSLQFERGFRQPTSICAKENKLLVGFDSNQLLLKDRRKLTENLSSFRFNAAVLSTVFLDKERIAAGAGSMDKTVKFFDLQQSSALNPYASVTTNGQVTSLAKIGRQLAVGLGFSGGDAFNFYMLPKNFDPPQLVGRTEKISPSDRVIQLVQSHANKEAYAYMVGEKKSRVKKIKVVENSLLKGQKKKQRHSSNVIR